MTLNSINSYRGEGLGSINSPDSNSRKVVKSKSEGVLDQLKGKASAKKNEATATEKGIKSFMRSSLSAIPFFGRAFKNRQETSKREKAKNSADSLIIVSDSEVFSANEIRLKEGHRLLSRFIKLNQEVEKKLTDKEGELAADEDESEGHESVNKTRGAKDSENLIEQELTPKTNYMVFEALENESVRKASIKDSKAPIEKEEKNLSHYTTIEEPTFQEIKSDKKYEGYENNKNYITIEDKENISDISVDLSLSEKSKPPLFKGKEAETVINTAIADYSTADLSIPNTYNYAGLDSPADGKEVGNSMSLKSPPEEKKLGTTTHTATAGPSATNTHTYTKEDLKKIMTELKHITDEKIKENCAKIICEFKEDYDKNKENSEIYNLIEYTKNLRKENETKIVAEFQHQIDGLKIDLVIKCSDKVNKVCFKTELIGEGGFKKAYSSTTVLKELVGEEGVQEGKSQLIIPEFKERVHIVASPMGKTDSLREIAVYQKLMTIVDQEVKRRCEENGWNNLSETKLKELKKQVQEELFPNTFMPHSIAPIREANATDGKEKYAISMDRGVKDLNTLLKEKRKLEPKEALSLISQMANSLLHLRKNAGIAHHDPNLGNFLLKDGKVYTIDFGTSQEGDNIPYGMSVPNAPPEFLKALFEYKTAGKSDLEQKKGVKLDNYLKNFNAEKSDLYQLGMTLFQLLTGITQNGLPKAWRESYKAESVESYPEDEVKRLELYCNMKKSPEDLFEKNGKSISDQPVTFTNHTNTEETVNLKEFLLKMLDPDPKNRPTLEDLKLFADAYIASTS